MAASDLPASLDELLARHSNDERFIRAKLSQLSKPKLGQKPLSKEQVEEQTVRLTTEMRERHSAERLELESRIASALTTAPIIDEHSRVESFSKCDNVTVDESTAAINVTVRETGTTPIPVTAAAAAAAGSLSHGTGIPSPLPSSVVSPGSTGTRAERRRQKKAADARARLDEDIVATSSPSSMSAKELELEQLRIQLEPLGLGVKPVAADGNCLYRAVSDQLTQLAACGAAKSSSAPDHLALRHAAAEHIRLHPAEFGPFLPYEPQDAFPEGVNPDEKAVQAAVDRYCARMARSGIWGGHPELRALATFLLTPIVVHEAGAPAQTLLPITDAELKTGSTNGMNGTSLFGGSALQLSFHRHYYALGEHYNSVVQLVSGR